MTLRDSSDLVIHRIKIWAVRRPQVGRKKSGITWRSSSTVARVPVHCAAGIQSHYRDTAYRWQQFLSQKHIMIVCSVYIFARFNKNKCIGGWNSYTLQCGMWLWNRDSKFNSGSTLQCDTWLWDDMPLNSPGGSTCNVTRSSGIMTLNSPGGSTLQCGRWLSKSDHPRHKNDVMSIFKMADLSHLEFLGSNNGFFEKPNYNLLNCLVFEKIAFLHFGVKIQDGGSPPSWILGVQ